MSDQRRSKSKLWHQRQAKDQFVRQARQEGLRSRAVFKLREIQKQDRPVAKGMRVIELGCAPGGWTQDLVDWVGPKGQVVGVDLLEMASVPGATILQGDFTDLNTQEALFQTFDQCDVIVSDMAPNLSGNRSQDQWQMTALFEEAWALAEERLCVGGNLVFKMFHGDGFEDCLKCLRQNFRTVKVRKPGASRAKSKECYLVALSKSERA